MLIFRSQEGISRYTVLIGNSNEKYFTRFSFIINTSSFLFQSVFSCCDGMRINATKLEETFYGTICASLINLI